MSSDYQLPPGSAFTAADFAKADAEIEEIKRRDAEAYAAMPRERSPAPPVLYKYLAPNRAVDALQSLEFKFTPPNEFADIFDSTWFENEAAGVNEPGSDIYFVFIDPENGCAMHGEVEKFKSFCEETKRLFPDYTGTKAILMNPPFRNDRERSDFLIGFRREIRDRAAEQVVFCLTESCDNMLLWQNYAEGSRGICIGIKGDADLFYVEKTARIERVLYLADPTVTGSLEVSLSRRFVVKHADLKNEREWRLIIHKSETDERNADGTKMYFRRASPADIIEVIVGSRASPDLVDRVKSAAPPGVPIRRAAIQPGRQRLRFDTIAE